MITKEILLQKGLSEQDADEIIGKIEESASEDTENSLQLLEKALNEGSGEAEEPLNKAKKEDDDDESEKEESEKDDYDEKYMKKHMRRFMKENKKACGKMAKEAGLYSESMKKAIDEIDENMDGAVMEMADLKPVMTKLPEVIDFMAKAINDLSEQVTAISEQNEKSFDLMQKAGKVTVETAKSIDGFLSQPVGRKGQTSVSGEEMKKATELTLSPENAKHVYTKLMKAVRDGDRQAGQVISAFESAGQNINRLNPDHRRYIGELLQKEAN